MERANYVDYHRDMDMHTPAHPGELLTGWLEDLHLTVTGEAGHLGVSRVTPP